MTKKSINNENIVLQMKGITKRFPGIIANNKINLELKEGEILALLGENGAGKSTLMSILCGLYQPDEGEIYIRGEKVNITSPKKAMDLGIGMVHQHFMLIETHSVTENIVLGTKNLSFFPDMKKLNSSIEELSLSYGLPVTPDAKIWQLPVGEQQRVEIVKVLYRGAEILILDEPTAVLTPQESEELFKTLRKMTERGHSIIFISHKLDEVMALSDRITVLRAGELVGTVPTSSIKDKKELARMMVGKEVLMELEKTSPEKEKREGLLEIRSLKAFNDKGLEALKGINLTISGGEIMGLAGVAGNGQSELAEVITGLRKISEGEIFLSGENITGKGVKDLIEKGVSYIPADRLGTGLVPNLDMADNAVLKGYRNPPYSRNIFLVKPAIDELVSSMIERYDIKVADIKSPVRLLSGGNLQKLLLARELLGEPVLIIAVYPARGLDIGATKFVHTVLLEQRKRGAAILLISEDLDETMSLSDRIAVIFDGKIMGILDGDIADKETLGLMMAGSIPEGTKNADKV